MGVANAASFARRSRKDHFDFVTHLSELTEICTHAVVIEQGCLKANRSLDFCTRGGFIRQ